MLFPTILVRILLGKVVDCHLSGSSLILLWLLAASFWAFSDLGIVDVLVLSLRVSGPHLKIGLHVSSADPTVAADKIDI